MKITGIDASEGSIPEELVIPNTRVSCIVYQRESSNETCKSADIRYSASESCSSIDSESALEFAVRQDEQSRQDKVCNECSLTSHARGKAVCIDIVGRAETGREGLPTQTEVAKQFTERLSRKIAWYRVASVPDQANGGYPRARLACSTSTSTLAGPCWNGAWHAQASELLALACDYWPDEVSDGFWAGNDEHKRAVAERRATKAKLDGLHRVKTGAQLTVEKAAKDEAIAAPKPVVPAN